MTSVGKKELRTHTSINAKFFHSRDLRIFLLWPPFWIPFFPRGLGRLIPSFVAQYESMKSFNWLINRQIFTNFHEINELKRVKNSVGVLWSIRKFQLAFSTHHPPHTHTHTRFGTQIVFITTKTLNASTHTWDWTDKNKYLKLLSQIVEKNTNMPNSLKQQKGKKTIRGSGGMGKFVSALCL